MTGLGSSCGACKFLRRKCSNECVFAPYFCYDDAATHFAAVHRVFGASNVSKLLLHLPVHNRRDAAITMSYEALARMCDPIHGCVAHIFALQQQVASLQEEIEILGNHMASLNIGIANCGSLETSLITTCEAQSFSFPDPMNKQCYQNYQSPPAQQSYHGGYNAIENQTVSGVLNAPDLLYGWGQQNSFIESSQENNNLEKLLQGVDKETLAYFSLLDLDTNINNCGGPQWY